jgi:HEAT repeat protein
MIIERIHSILIIWILLFLSPILNADGGTKAKSEGWQINGLLAALEDKIPQVQALALDKLRELGELKKIPGEKLHKITDLLDGPNDGVRVSALKALADIEYCPPKDIPEVVFLLNDRNDNVRTAVLEALGNLGLLARPYIPKILSLLKDRNESVRNKAAEALSNLNNVAKSFVPRIATLLEDEAPSVRNAASSALAMFSNYSNDDWDKFNEALKYMYGINHYDAAKILVNYCLCFEDGIQNVANLLDKKNVPSVRHAAIVALGELGDSSRKYIPKIAGALSDRRSDIRLAALRFLAKYKDLPDDYTSMIITSLESERFIDKKASDSPWRNFRFFDQEAVLNALINCRKAAKDSFITQIAKLLKHKNGYIRSTAVIILGKFCEQSMDYLPQIIDLLKDTDKDWMFSGKDAVTAITQICKSNKNYIPEIEKLLKHEEWSIRTDAVKILFNLGELALDYIPHLQSLFNEDVRYAESVIGTGTDEFQGNYGEYRLDTEYFLNEENWVTTYAEVKLLGIVLNLYKKRESKIVAFLESNNFFKRHGALWALGNLPGVSKMYIPEIAPLIKENNADLAYAAVRAISSMGVIPLEYIPRILALANHKNLHVRRMALKVLKNQGKLPHEYIPGITNFLNKTSPGDYSRAAGVLLNQGKIDFKLLPYILNSVYHNASLSDEIRFLSHFLGGGEEKVEILLKWLGEPGNNYPKELTHDEARKTLTVFCDVWGASGNLDKLTPELLDQIAVIIGKDSIEWKNHDLSLLQKAAKILKTNQSIFIKPLEMEIRSIKTKKYVFLILIFSGIHGISWFVLLFLYPHSTKIQTVFYWNPYIRKIIGFGYINFLLIRVPYLKRKMFSPFWEILLADADPEGFKKECCFEKSEVNTQNSNEFIALKKTIPRIKGQIVLEGEPGPGKSMLLRWLASRTRHPGVFLPAKKCSAGIIPAIQAKLHPVIKDSAFLSKLVCRGAIDIYIDGLNEVGAASRAEIKHFMETHPGINIIITLQPMGWTPPPNVKIYRLPPLKENRVEDFVNDNFIKLLQSREIQNKKCVEEK